MPEHDTRARRRLPGALLLLGLALPPAVAVPQSGTDSIDSGLEEQAAAWLSVVRVRIEQGRHAEMGECRALGPDDLVVTVQGEELTGTESISLDWNRPPTLHALVIDNSASMAPDLAYAKHAAKEYVKQLQPDREQGLVMTFDENVVLMLAPTADRTALLRAIDRVRNGSRTSMLDAFHYAMQELDSHRERPVLILLSDGADTSSLHLVEDIEKQASNRPDLTVFTVGLGLRTDEGVKPTRQLLRRLPQATHGRFFDVAAGESLGKVFATIRDILDSEAILTVVDPDPRADRDRIRVESRNKNCRITVLDVSTEELASAPARRPIPRPYAEPPQTYEADLEPAHYNALSRSAERVVDPGCSAGRFFGLALWDGRFEPKWFFHVGQRQASACGPDVTMDFGRLYDPGRETLFEHNDRLRLTARPFEVPIPPLERLPHSPEQAFDHIAAHALTLADSEFPTESWRREGEGHAEPFQDYPSLVHGMTFLGMRSVLARAQFLYPDYREWVLDRLTEQAAEELETLVGRYRRQFPDYPTEIVEDAARQSVEGRRIAATAEAPSEIDLQPFLAAWLGDIPAHELFVRWEQRRIDRAIEGVAPGPLDARFAEAWREARRVMFAPSYARVLTMLVPVHDLDRDRIGFWRVVLPRPGWLAARVTGLTAGRDVTGDLLDLVPEQPVAWRLFERISAGSPELMRFLRANGYRAADLRYELLGEPSGHTPEAAFTQCRVDLAFSPERSAGEPEAPRFGIRFDVLLDRGGEEPALEFLAFEVDASPGALPDPMIEEIRLAARAILRPEPVVGAPAAVAVSAAEPETRAPEAVRAPQERATVVAVEVPVRVLRDGEPVRGLTVADFELLDKGKKQTLSAFDVVDLTAASQDALDAGAAELPRAARRHFLFLFDLAFSSPGALLRARRSVAGIVDRMHPADEAAVAVYTPDQGSRLVAGFTSDRDRIRRAVETARARDARGGPRGVARLRHGRDRCRRPPARPGHERHGRGGAATPRVDPGRDGGRRPDRPESERRRAEPRPRRRGAGAEPGAGTKARRLSLGGVRQLAASRRERCRGAGPHGPGRGGRPDLGGSFRPAVRQRGCAVRVRRDDRGVPPGGLRRPLRGHRRHGGAAHRARAIRGGRPVHDGAGHRGRVLPGLERSGRGRGTTAARDRLLLRVDLPAREPEVRRRLPQATRQAEECAARDQAVSPPRVLRTGAPRGGPPAGPPRSVTCRGTTALSARSSRICRGSCAPSRATRPRRTASGGSRPAAGPAAAS